MNLLNDRDANGRVYAATYPTMMGSIEEKVGVERRFGVGHFDLVIIDEAHRSVFQRYRAIFDYFDSLLVGLTATPRDEIDRNTYGLFNIENGVPTFAYSLEQAIDDRYLVPMRGESIGTRFLRDGVRYDDRTDDEKAQWDELDWGEEFDDPPDEVDSVAINRWLFNEDTVDKVLEHLMRNGQHVAGGDRLGKTIMFAANQRHTQFIYERFNANYPHYKGSFAQVITHATAAPDALIENFKVKDNEPHIAISVDMLDTGVDVPEVVNLVFFKMVRSKTEFWQMVGRGTRLCPDLFGPGDDKTHFTVFDASSGWNAPPSSKRSAGSPRRPGTTPTSWSSSTW